jgi:hypothetical protein
VTIPAPVPIPNVGVGGLGFVLAGIGLLAWCRRRPNRLSIRRKDPFEPLSAILILGAGPVGQPSPGTITTAVRLAPRQPSNGAVEAVVSGIHSGLGAACGRSQARHGHRRKRRGGKD